MAVAAAVLAAARVSASTSSLVARLRPFTVSEYHLLQVFRLHVSPYGCLGAGLFYLAL